MKRKSQGSTLIVGVIIFTFVIIVMTAMLSMIVGNYKARASESKRVENLYGAESGLDVAYNIIGQTFNAAVTYGNSQVANLDQNTNSPNNEKYSKLMKDINYWKSRAIPNDKKDDGNYVKKFKEENRLNIIEDNDNIELLKNEEFKRTFNEFLYKTDSTNNLDNTKNIENVDELAKSIVGRKYIKSINKDKVVYENVNFNRNNGEQDPTLLVCDDKNQTAGIDPNKDKSGILYNAGEENLSKSIDRKLADDYELTIDVYDNQKYIVKVTSNFETISANGPNLREVQATYKIKVPDYMQSLKTYSIFNNKSLVVGKNMNINDINNFNVSGDVFVQGEMEWEDETGEIAYDKYLGGIKIDKSKNVNFNNDVITRSTFNIIDDVGVNIKTNLYARNVYAGKGNDFASGLDTENGKSKLDIKNDLVVDNDLTLKAKNTDITIGNFYGINDKTVKSNSNEDKDRNSSCIIVNENENSNVKIKDNGSAYIMGVAYIDTKDISGEKSQPYKTGESVAVKGNYTAYSVPNESKTNEKFSYHNPLYLLDDDGSGDEVDQKSEHFQQYWHDKLIDSGGIQLPDNTWANGAVVYKDINEKIQVKNDPTKKINQMTEENIIKPKRRDYAAKVYKFGETASDDDYTSGEDSATDVSELMNFSNIDINYSLNNQAKKSEKAIFNKEDRKIIIRESNSEESIDVPDDSKSDITIKVKNGILNAVVATAGDVEIDGNVTFNGSIITNGNLDIKGNGITIKNDINVVKKVQSENADLFESVFKDGQYDVNNTANYDLSSYLANKLWKLIK